MNLCVCVPQYPIDGAEYRSYEQAQVGGNFKRSCAKFFVPYTSRHDTKDKQCHYLEKLVANGYQGPDCSI